MSEDEFDPTEVMAALRAQTDQMVEVASEVARATASFYRQLLTESVPQGTAMILTVEWMRIMVGNHGSPDEEEPDGT